MTEEMLVAETCSNCATELPDGVSFCPECGTATRAADAPLPPQHWPESPPAHPPTPTTGPPTASSWPPVASPPTAQAAREPATEVRNTVAGILGVVGAVVLGVASFLPWAEVSLAVAGGPSQTVSGWDWFDNGVATGPLFALFALVAAALTGLVFAQVAPLAARIAIVAVGSLSVGLSAFAASEILDRRGEVQSLGSVEVTFEYGLVLLVLGGLAILVSGLLTRHPAGTTGR